MSSPPATLRVIAGCNGSGKSTYSAMLAGNQVVPFDYDKIFKVHYDALFDSELRDRMAHNMSRATLKNAVEGAIASKADFAYETNFNDEPMFWPRKFKAAGYQLELCFFCLETVAEAKRRVQFRYQNGGHFVPDNEVEDRFSKGYINLDALFNQFDAVHLFDTNAVGKVPSYLGSITADGIAISNTYPVFLHEKLPFLSEYLRTY